MPYAGTDGYHSKTIAYSIWHIFRIEDIVAHSLIRRDEEIFFEKGYKEKMHAPIVTTGNELAGQEIAEFSKQLDLENLYRYALDVIKMPFSRHWIMHIEASLRIATKG